MTKHQAIDRITQHLSQLDEKALEGLLLFLEFSLETNSEDETQAVLRDHPDILERIKRLESGESKTIPWETVKAELGL
jgi:Zn-dependent protease with chaperone function